MLIDRLAGVWFPIAALAATLLPLGGARSPFVANVLTFAVGLAFCAYLTHKILAEGAGKAANELLDDTWLPALLALPLLAWMQALCQIFLGFSDAPTHALTSGALGLTVLTGFFLLARAGISDTRAFRVCCGAIVLIGALEALYGLLNLLGGNATILGHERWLHFNSATGTFYSRNQFAYLLEMTLPLGLAFAAQFTGLSRRRGYRRSSSQDEIGRRVIALTAVVTMAVALLFSRSRMGIVSLAMAAGVVSAVNWAVRPDSDGPARSRGLSLTAVAVLAVIGFSAVIGVEPVFERFFNVAQDLESGRGPLWQVTIAMAAERPILGHGWGAYEGLISSYRPRPTGLYYDHAHNEYLEVLAETGLIGLAIVAMLIGLFARRLVRSLSTTLSDVQRTTIVALGVAITSVLLHSAADFGLRVPAIALLFVLVLALFCRATDDPRLIESEFDPADAVWPATTDVSTLARGRNR